MRGLVAICVALCTGLGFAADEKRVAAWEGGERTAALEWFYSNQFGRTPIGRPADQKIDALGVSFADSRIRIDIHVRLPKAASPSNPVPVFVFGNHRYRNLPDGSLKFAEYPNIPTNAVLERGYAYVTWYLNSVCPDANTWEKTMARSTDGVIAWAATGDPAARGIVRPADGWGTIGAWAWGYSRVMDWIETRPELDATRVAIVGHSRGGKTALWAAAQDTRIAMAVSNDSGCGGAKRSAVESVKSEHFKDILGAFPNWFCPNFTKWIGRDAEVPHDGDDLLRLIAPRLCYVASAEDDSWASPAAEWAAWDAARELWAAYGRPDGIGYHVRPGGHALTPVDWVRFLDFADKNLK